MKEALFKLYTKLLFFILVSFGCMNMLISQETDQGIGNWYEKLHWWKKAKPKYQEIVSSVKRIKRNKKEFIAQRSIITSTIHDLIDSLKINNKQLFGKINNYILEMDTKIEESYSEGIEGSLTIDQLTENRKNLEKLKQDFRLLDDLGTKVNEAIEHVLASQIERAESYEEQAMNKLEQLENVLDDKKAKNFYVEIQNKADNILAIEDYIQGSLKGYLSQSSIRLNQLIHEIKHLINELEAQKIYLSQVIIEPEQEIINDEIEKKEKPFVKEEKPSFLSKISLFFNTIFNKIWHIVTYPFKFFLSMLYP